MQVVKIFSLDRGDPDIDIFSADGLSDYDRVLGPSCFEVIRYSGGCYHRRKAHEWNMWKCFAKSSNTGVLWSKSGTSPRLNAVAFVNGEGQYPRIQVAAAFSQDVVPKIPCFLEYGLWRCENDVVFPLRNLFPCFLAALVSRHGNSLDTALLQVMRLSVNICTQECSKYLIFH